MRSYTLIEEAPAYPFRDAGHYLRLAAATVRRWADLVGGVSDPIPGEPDVRAISYVQLLELHVLKAMRLRHDVPLQRIRRALSYLQEHRPSAHPLLDNDFATDGLDLFLASDSNLVNASRGGQEEIQELVSLYVSRIKWERNGHPVFSPFVQADRPGEPESITIQPTVAFGRSVIAGTGVATEVVAGRFSQRESLADLAVEYDVSPSIIEEAIRWEFLPLHAA